MAAVHPKGTYSKRIKFNLIVCDVSGTPTGGTWESGTYIKMEEFYSELYQADINNIFYETNGDSKILEFDTLANITGLQLIVSEDKQKLYFYDAPLIEPCYTKSLKEAKLNEGLEDINGEPLYDIDGSRLYALKEGVVIE